MANISINEDGSIAIKALTSTELDVFNGILGNPMANNAEPVNEANGQYSIIVKINNSDYTYNVYDEPNDGIPNVYTIELQKNKDK